MHGLKTRTRTRTRPQGPGQGQGPDPQGPRQGQGPDPKDQDKDKDLKYVLKESLRTRTKTMINIAALSHVTPLKPRQHGRRL